MKWLKVVLYNYQSTVLKVTHDIEEALVFSTRIIVLGGSPVTIIGEFSINEKNVKSNIIQLIKGEKDEYKLG
jgi:NitT/TauT family transport system ATP-binding protein